MSDKALHFLGVTITAMFLSTTLATAQALSDCDDWRSSILGIAEPWEANTKTFTEDTVRMTIMDVGEPVAGSYRLLILTPPTADNPDARQCQVLSLDADLGFAGLSFDGMTNSTDPTGLTVVIPAKRWVAETDTYIDAKLSVTVNATDGAIAASLEN